MEDKQGRRIKRKPRFKGIVNLSSYEPTIDELKLLSKGLKYIPTTYIEPLSIQKDILLFERRIKLLHYHKDTSPSIYSNEKHPFKKSSGWTPTFSLPKHLNCFLVNFETKIREIDNKGTRSNITKKEKAAIKSLQENKGIIIRQADKGGAVVLWGRREYLNEAYRQLTNRAHYRPLAKDPTVITTREINLYIDEIEKKKIIDQTTASFLKIKNPRTPIFYMLPKIHKENNPGRPIISQTNGPTEKISQFLDFFLKPLAAKTDSYLKDTNSFLRIIEAISEIPSNTILVTIDVCSLYTNIPHKDGIRATTRALDTREDKTVPTEVLIKLLNYILKKTAFKFNKTFFEQIFGTTMGTTMAPNYSIITVDDLETRFLKTQVLCPLLWKRFIDDIFALWCWGEESLKLFIKELNDFHPTLKFTAEYSIKEINFLDVTVIKEGTKLYTTVYNKPTNANNYLHYNSCHARNQKDNIPYAQALRIRKICSRMKDFEENVAFLKSNLLHKKYPMDILESAIEKARQRDRLDILQSDKKDLCKVTPFCVSFHPKLQNINKILRQELEVLKHNPTTKHILENRIIVAFRKGRNLKDILVRSDIERKDKLEPGSFPCKAKCKICKYITPTKSVESRDKSYYFKIKSHLSCCSTSLIYMISCKKCGIQYIGQTGNSLKERMYGHFNDIANKNKYKPVSAHFTSGSHTENNVTITPLLATSQDLNIRLRYEEALIANFKTRHPFGLNLIS